jgi:hypothetical protein
LAKITLPEGNSQILTSQYQLYLPSENELLEEIKEVISISEDACLEEDEENG